MQKKIRTEKLKEIYTIQANSFSSILSDIFPSVFVLPLDVVLIRACIGKYKWLGSIRRSKWNYVTITTIYGEPESKENFVYFVLRENVCSLVS